MKKRIFLLLLLFLSIFSLGFSRPNLIQFNSLDLETNVYDNLREYLKDSSEKILNPEDENPIFSPLSLYLTLSMMAETLNDEVQEEILSYLNVSSMEELRSNNQEILTSFGDDSIAKEFKIRNLSFREVSQEQYFNSNIVDILSNNYLASDHSTDLIENGPSLMSQEIKETTDDFLDISEQSLEPFFQGDLVNVLMNVLYFKDNWREQFKTSEIEKKDFHIDDTRTVSVDNLIGKRKTTYFESEYYQAAFLPFEKGSRIYFVLPKDGYSVNDCLEQNAITDIAKDWPEINSFFAEVDLNIPKFDVKYNNDLTQILIDEGLDKVYTLRTDSPFYTGTDPYGYVATLQASRVLLDEEGVKAASATFGCGMTSAGPTEPVELHLNKPFIYFITSQDYLVLFSGIINHF